MSKLRKNVIPFRDKNRKDNKERVLVICRLPDGHNKPIPIPHHLADEIKDEMKKHDAEDGELIIDHRDAPESLLSRYELLHNVVSAFEEKVLIINSSFNNRNISKEKMISYSDDRTCRFKDMDSVTYIFTIKTSTLNDNLQIRFSINPNTNRDIDLEVVYSDQGMSSVHYQDIHADDMEINQNFFNGLIRWYIERYRKMISKGIIAQGRLEKPDVYRRELLNDQLRRFEVVSRGFVYQKDMNRFKQD